MASGEGGRGSGWGSYTLAVRSTYMIRCWPTSYTRPFVQPARTYHLVSEEVERWQLSQQEAQPSWQERQQLAAPQLHQSVLLHVLVLLNHFQVLVRTAIYGFQVPRPLLTLTAGRHQDHYNSSSCLSRQSAWLSN